MRLRTSSSEQLVSELGITDNWQMLFRLGITEEDWKDVPFGDKWIESLEKIDPGEIETNSQWLYPFLPRPMRQLVDDLSEMDGIRYNHSHVGLRSVKYTFFSYTADGGNTPDIELATIRDNAGIYLRKRDEVTWSRPVGVDATPVEFDTVLMMTRCGNPRRHADFVIKLGEYCLEHNVTVRMTGNQCNEPNSLAFHP